MRSRRHCFFVKTKIPVFTYCIQHLLANNTKGERMKDKEEKNASAQMLINLSQNAQTTNLYAGLFPPSQMLLGRFTNEDEERERIEELTNSAEKIDRDYELRKSQFEKKLSIAEHKMAALEDAYSKKLQLEGPAQHWKNLSRFYLGWGWGLLVLSLVLGGVAIGGLFWLLVQADTIVIFNENKLSLSTIRASLILIAATSMAGYLLHLFTKLAISCFHLSRDYRERFQLTNVFLALLRDGDVKCDDQVKQIVMQALFSRSDTGLLKGEHSFKMPGVADLVRKEDS